MKQRIDQKAPPPSQDEVAVSPPDEPASASPAPGDSSPAYLLYLREIGKTPLLTPADEVALARRIQAGDEAAREEMIKANLRLVVKIARDYEHYGVPLLDLISEGNIGLMKAVERFDPNRGAKLSTYASWWIKQAIRRALSNQSKTIRLPVHVGDKLLQMRRTSARLEEVLGREPSHEELADEMDLSVARVTALRRTALPPASLDAPRGDSEGKDFAELIGDERTLTPYARLEQKATGEMLQEMLGSLTERERMILQARFGFSGESRQTLEEIGQEFGITRERIRQIQNQALQKLRKMIEERETVGLAA